MANRKNTKSHPQKRKPTPRQSRAEYDFMDMSGIEGDTKEGSAEEYEPEEYAEGISAEEYEPEEYAEGISAEEYEPEEYAEEPSAEEYEPEEYAEEPPAEEYGVEEYAEEPPAEEYGAEEYTEEPFVEEYESEDYSEDERGYAAGSKRRTSPGRKKKRSRRWTGTLLCTLIVLLMLVGLGYLLLPSYCVKIEKTIEAGENCPKVSEFLNWGNEAAYFVSEINENTVMNHVGDYGVIIRVYGRNVAAVLHVRDTVAPEVSAKDCTIFGGQSVTLEDFIEQVSDVTDTKVRFKEEPDCTAEGLNEVVLQVEDEGGNVTEVTAMLEVIYDTEPPVIQGVTELTMTAGTSISYKKGVTVTDNYDEDVKLTVDASEADTTKAGNYTIVYKAVDSAGNETTVSTILHVKPVTVETVTEELIYAEADKVLASIFKEGMTQYEQLRAIYDFCHDKIAYSDGTPKTNWIQGAYRGLVNRKGDCYVYAMTAKCLLTRAGITNMDIERIRVGNSMHYWNLVDIGEGWHHFDTCRRADGSTFFYKTDAEIMEYSNAHNGTHNYDRSLYPEIP